MADPLPGLDRQEQEYRREGPLREAMQVAGKIRPRSEALEEREQRVWWLVASGLGAGRRGAVNRAL